MKEFLLAYDGFDPGTEGLRESLTSTGNGYFCTRGTAEWEDAAGVHYPGTYVHGGFNRETTILGGRPVLNEDLVNLPNWLVLKLRIEGGESRSGSTTSNWSPTSTPTTSGWRWWRGCCASVTAPAGDDAAQPPVREHGPQPPGRHRVDVDTRELVGSSRGDLRPRRPGDQPDGRPLSRTGGSPPRPGAPRTFGPETIALKVRTRQSNIYVAQAARTRVFSGGEPVAVERDLHQMQDYIQQVLAFDVVQGEAVRVEKMVALFTSHDNAIYRDADRRGPGCAALPGVRRRVGGARGGVDGAVGGLRPRVCRTTAVQLAAAASTSSTSCRPCSRHTAPTSTWACRPAACTARPTAATSSGTSSSSSRSSTSGSPSSPAALLRYRYRRLGEARGAAQEAGYAGRDVPLAERQRRPRGDAASST